jgi:DNA-binding transcriptional LysR family regulator
MEQSPLSRTIKELEDRLGVRLFNRDRRGTHLTRAGEVFLQDVRRVFTALEQAKEGARAAAAGHCGLLRVALSDGATQPRLAALLALCREEEPSVEIRLSEVPLIEQLRGLRDGTFDAGFARSDEVGDAYPLWREPLVVAVPSRHPLLAHRLIPLEELLRYPLVMCHPEVCEGYCRQVDRVLRAVEVEPNIAERATSLEMMLTLVAAGYGVGFAAAERIAVCRHPEVVVRPLAHDDAELTTYLLTKTDAEGSERLDAFVGRAMREAQISNPEN